jgi:hypothetical protein
MIGFAVLQYIINILENRYGSVAIATGYVLDGRTSISGMARDFSLLHIFQIGSEAHPVSYPMGTGVFLQEVKRPEREADLSPSSAEVKNCGAIPLLSRLQGVLHNKLITRTLPLTI